MKSLFEKFSNYGRKDALVINDISYSYRDVLSEVNDWIDLISLSEISPGMVVAIEGENSLSLIGLMLALASNKNIVVPLKTETLLQSEGLKTLAQANFSINLDDKIPRFKALNHYSDHIYYKTLRNDNHAGVVLFSSGTTGKPKGIVLSFSKMIKKAELRESNTRILSFLSYDHVGGLNTILYSLCSGGCVIFPQERSVENVLKTIQTWRVEVLPTTPTFINMLLMSGSVSEYDLSSLSLITYGTETMPEVTLKRASILFPEAIFKQTYGLSEVGILPTKSKSSNELWLKIGGSGFNYKIVNNILWIKSDMSMLGYLNADAPFDDEGYFNTQDIVEIDGDYIRILGRQSEIINVAGEKVYPAEIEGVLCQVAKVLDVVIMPEKNPVTGMSIKALICHEKDCDVAELRRQIIRYAKENLEGYKQPMLYNFTQEKLHSSRYKKKRIYGAKAA